MLTLWDLLLPAAKRLLRGSCKKPIPPKATTRRATTPKVTPATARYETMTATMLERYSVRVRKWRTSMSGVAWEVYYRDGSRSRLIEAPRPKGPMSAAVFLHEIGHHAIGFNTYSPRCLEELYAWRFALSEMERWEIAITERVQTRMDRSMRYAVSKAQRRGIKRLPPELEPYARSR